MPRGRPRGRPRARPGEDRERELLLPSAFFRRGSGEGDLDRDRYLPRPRLPASFLPTGLGGDLVLDRL